jgi:hypothetical protein
MPITQPTFENEKNYNQKHAGRGGLSLHHFNSSTIVLVEVEAVVYIHSSPFMSPTRMDDNFSC